MTAAPLRPEKLIATPEVPQLRRMVEEAAEERRLCVITGPSGSRKTTLSLHAAERAATKLGHRVGRDASKMKPKGNDLYRQLIESVTERPACGSRDALVEQWLDIVREQPTIFVIDEAHRFGPAGLEEIEWLWELHRTCFLLVGLDRLAKTVNKNETLVSRRDWVQLDRLEGAERDRVLVTIHPAFSKLTAGARRWLEQRCGDNLHDWRRMADKLERVAALHDLPAVFGDKQLEAVKRDLS